MNHAKTQRSKAAKKWQPETGSIRRLRHERLQMGPLRLCPFASLREIYLLALTVLVVSAASEDSRAQSRVPMAPKIVKQLALPVVYEGVRLELGFRADLVIDNKVIIEIKSVELLAPVHRKQVETYLRLTGLKLGLLINFNVELIKNGIQRVVNRLPE